MQSKISRTRASSVSAGRPVAGLRPRTPDRNTIPLYSTARAHGPVASGTSGTPIVRTISLIGGDEGVGIIGRDRLGGGAGGRRGGKLQRVAPAFVAAGKQPLRLAAAEKAHELLHLAQRSIG